MAEQKKGYWQLGRPELTVTSDSLVIVIHSLITLRLQVSSSLPSDLLQVEIQGTKNCLIFPSPMGYGISQDTSDLVED
jgi:hypothetical protein